MHVLQPKHTRMKPDEVKKLLEKYNITVSQLPKIKKDDPAAPADCQTGEVLKIEREEDGKIHSYFRVVV